MSMSLNDSVYAPHRLRQVIELWIDTSELIERSAAEPPKADVQGLLQHLCEFQVMLEELREIIAKLVPAHQVLLLEIEEPDLHDTYEKIEKYEADVVKNLIRIKKMLFRLRIKLDPVRGYDWKTRKNI
ncbi:hypothetical protein SLEP1_g42788 [Rubroshorea leprosula]|uniref:Uncharacterized protein n=1 Tax=Rubroshorea leprosula TaxID=152421 RepID=A0AAV5LAY2_9ROSI|nr:hypothetical protein SLEP1_g42788 [Rubroshorea leprosula]